MKIYYFPNLKNNEMKYYTTHTIDNKLVGLLFINMEVFQY